MVPVPNLKELSTERDGVTYVMAHGEPCATGLDLATGVQKAGGELGGKCLEKPESTKWQQDGFEGFDSLSTGKKGFVFVLTMQLLQETFYTQSSLISSVVDYVLC